MFVILIDEEHDCSESLIMKLAKSKNGSVIPLTRAEMDLYASDSVQILRFDDSGSLSFKVKEGEKHIFVVDPKLVNIDDIAQSCSTLGIEFGIIRNSLSPDYSPIVQ